MPGANELGKLNAESSRTGPRGGRSTKTEEVGPP